jgi:hypothetical protein
MIQITENEIINQDGVKYKVGKFNFVYTWINGHWMRSQKTIEDLKLYKEGKRIRW